MPLRYARLHHPVLGFLTVAVAALTLIACDREVSRQTLTFTDVTSTAELDRALQDAENREVMLEFDADWCVACKEMERFTFSDPAVQARLKDVVLLRADVTANTPEDKELLKRFTLFGPPGIFFWTPEGQQSDVRVIGFEKPEKFLASIAAATGKPEGP